MVSQQASIPAPSKDVLAALHSAARHSTRFHWLVTPTWRPALAAAASMLLCLTGVRFMLSDMGSGSYSRNAATEIVPLSAWVMGSDEDQVAAKGDSAMSLLADQMLILQGMKVEAAEETASESTGSEDSRPTTLLWNNSSEPLPGIHV